MRHKARQTCPVIDCHGERRGRDAVCDRCWRRLPGWLRGALTAARLGGRYAEYSRRSIEARDWLNARPIAAAMDARHSPRDAREMIDNSASA